MTTTQKWTFVYGAAVHVLSLIACVVLIGLGRATWVELGPYITGLIGLGIGVPLVVNGGTVTNPPAATPPSAPPPAS